jgi:hypothetical protein
VNERVLIATSIAPNSRIETQKRAVESWATAGFDVVSYNHADEIAILAPQFPGVQFEAMLRTGVLLAGKPVVFISDVVQKLKQTERALCGIVNSDILLKPDPRFLSAIRTYGEAGLVYGPRFDVASLSDEKGTLDRFGFDFFFFPRRIMDSFGESRLCIGMPYWDHWFPLMPLLAGHPTTKLIGNSARHVLHPTDRDDSFFLFADEFIQTILARIGAAPANATSPLPDEVKAGYEVAKQAAIDAESRNAGDAERMRHIEALAAMVDRISQYVVLYLDRNSKRVILD